METPKFVTEMSIESGFDYAEYLGECKGEQVYAPMFYNPDTVFGRPRFIHVKGEKWRWSKSHSEASQVIDFFNWR